MADEHSPGEPIDDLTLVRELMFNLQECAAYRKGARLTAESTRYAMMAVERFYLALCDPLPFHGMHYQIMEWPEREPPNLVGQLRNEMLASAAFLAAIEAYPKSRVAVCHGAMVIRDSRTPKTRTLSQTIRVS